MSGHQYLKELVHAIECHIVIMREIILRCSLRSIDALSDKIAMISAGSSPAQYHSVPGTVLVTVCVSTTRMSRLLQGAKSSASWCPVLKL